MPEIGPVQLISIGFDRGSNFEGRMLGEGFLRPETIGTMEAKLAAISDAIAASER
jgi:hypothetical protein